MSVTCAALDRLAPTRRPPGRPIGYQCWSNLLFVHWRLPVELVQPLLPAELTLDTWDGDAWVGLVPFYMSGVRPWWSPAVPGVSAFCETNVRTYVAHRGANPGVWFFSLEAASSLAVRIARRRWRLPYFRADMSLTRSGDTLRYDSRRRWPGPPGAGCRIEARIGDPWRSPPDAGGRAAVGTLEHFLVERYLLYAQSSQGRLLTGQVHHPPYPLRHARIDQLEDTLLPALGLNPTAAPCHVAFSEGVSVDIFPLTAALPVR